MDENFNSYNLPSNNAINNPMFGYLNFSEDDQQKVKYIYKTSWIESPLFWLIFSFNSANIFGFIYFENYESEGVSIVIYILLTIIVGLPLLLIETFVSQFSRKRSIQLWDSLPLIGKGLSLTQCIITLIQSIVYTFLTATALRILFNIIVSLTSSSEHYILPWIKQNDSHCISLKDCDSNLFNHTSQTSNELKPTSNFSEESCSQYSLSEVYLLTDIWQLTDFENTINNWKIESFSYKLALFMIAIQVFIFLATLKSVETIMRYISVLIITLSILAFLALTIAVGIQNQFEAREYFISIFDNGLQALRQSTNWLTALSHVVTSFYLAIGFVPNFGHRIDFKHRKTYRNNMIAVFSNLLVFILLRLLSSMSAYYNRHFRADSVQLINHQIVLPFSIYVIVCDTLAFLSRDLNQTVVISLTIAFLLAIVMIGLQSIVLLSETTIGFFISREDKLSQRLKVKVIVTLLLLSSVLLATNRGSAIIMVLYTYGIVTPVIVCILLQLIILLWLYGIRSFQSDIHFMIDSVIPLPIRLSWTLFTPVILVGIYIAFLIQTEFWTHICLTKILLVSIVLIPVPLSVIIKLVKAPAYTLNERVKYVMNKKSDWGPTIPFYRRLWLNRNRTPSENLELMQARRHTFDTNRKSIIDINLTTTNN